MRLLFLILAVLSTSCASKSYTATDDLPVIPVKKSAEEARRAHMFYLIQSGKVEEAIDQLLVAKKEDPYLFHSGVLEELGLAILQQGARSQSTEDVVNCLYGVSIALETRALPVIDKAFVSDAPELQRTALSVLATLNTDQANAMLEEAMKSDYVMVRLEAAYLLAQRRAHSAFAHIDTLMLKVPSEIRPLFAELFALEGSGQSTLALRRLLFDQETDVRAEAVLAVTHHHRDDFLPEIHRLAQEPSSIQQEACSYAFGVFCDERAAASLQQIA
ncbi:MAG: hypothetical protein JSR46_09870, partial [Verrucomicrobia bacterium]|nr:hypothetical protein [Verrucomicrobiota bacterium]